MVVLAHPKRSLGMAVSDNGTSGGEKGVWVVHRENTSIILGITHHDARGEQWDKAGLNHSGDEDRLMCTKMFLQDYYENERETRLDDFLKFDVIMHEDKLQVDDDKLELELAKIAIVLLGIGVLDKNSQNFMSAVLRVPLEKHYDVLAIIQSVVQAGSSEVALSSMIEDILCEPSGVFPLELNNQGHNKKQQENSHGVRPNTPISNLLKSSLIEPAQASTPKELNKSWTSAAIATTSSAFHGSPLRLNMTLLNSSLRDITSPLRGLSIDASSSCSPLTQYAQSPQLIQKAILRQKETELRKLRRQMEDHIDRADELKYLLQDQTEAVAQKDVTIARLEKKVQELQRQNLHTELTESADAESKNIIEALTQKNQSLEQFKEQYLILEKESSMHAEEIRKLNCEITSLEQKNLAYKSKLDSQKHFGEDIEDQQMKLNSLEQQLEQMKAAKKEWESDRQCMQEKIDTLKGQNASLRQELEDVYPLQPGNASGETMGVVLDIQVEELKCQIDEAKQEQEKCQSLLQEKQDLLSQHEKEIQKLQNESSATQAKLSEADLLVRQQSTILEEKSEELESLKQQLGQEKNLNLNLQKETEILQGNLDEKYKQCSDNLEQLACLENKMLQKDECLTQLELTLKQKDSYLTDKEELVASKDKQLEDLKTENEKLNISILTFSQDILYKDDQIAQLQQDYKRAVQESQAKQAGLEAKIKQIDEQHAYSLSELQSSNAEEMSNVTAKYEERVKQLEQAMEKSHEEFAALQNLSSKQNVDLDEIKANMEAVSNSLELKRQQLSEKEDYIAKQKKCFETSLEEIYDDKCELQSLIEKLQKELDERIQQFQGIEKELVLKTEELSQKEEQIQEMRSDYENKAQAVELQSKEALESLRTELEAVKIKELQSLSQQIQTQRDEAAKSITEKNAQIGKLEQTVNELMYVKESMQVKLEESAMEMQEAKAQLQLKLKDVFDKENTIKHMEQDFQHQLSTAQQNNEKELVRLQAEIESIKETNIQTLSQTEISNKSCISKMKQQHEQDMAEILKRMEEKDTVAATLENTIADNAVELNKFKTDLEAAHLSLKMKDEEISSLKEAITRLEKLALEKDELMASLKKDFETQRAVEKSNHESAVQEAGAKVRAADEAKVKALSDQKAFFEAEKANQTAEHEEKVQNLIRANDDALRSLREAQKDAEERAEKQLTQEREEHSKLLEALGQDADKEREGYLQSLLIKRQEVEKLSAQLKDLQNEVLSLQEQSTEDKKELERVNEKLRNAEEKHIQGADLLGVQVSKNQELEELYQSLQHKMEQVEQNLTKSNSDLKEADELSKQQSEDLDQAKSDFQKVKQDLEDLQNVNEQLKDKTCHLQNQLDEGNRQNSAETQSLKNAIVEKDTLISTFTSEIEQKVTKIVGLQQTLSDQAAQLEAYMSSLDAAKMTALENKETIHQLQQDITNKDELINKMNKDFEGQRLSVQKDNKTLIDQLELKYKAAKECELKALSDQEMNFKTELERLQSQKDKQLQELSEAKSNLEKENKTLNFDLKAKTQQHMDVIKELEALARKASETESQLCSTKRKLEESDADLLVYQTKTADKDIELHSVENDLKSTIEELHKKDQTINSLKDEFAEKITRLKEENKISQMEIQSKLEEDLKTEIAKAAEQQLAIENYKEQLNEFKTKYESEITALNEDIAKLLARIKKLEEQETIHFRQREESDKLVKQKNAEAEQLHLKIQNLEQVGKSQQFHCDKSQELLGQKEEEIVELQSRIESFDSQLCQQRELLDSKEQSISELQVKVDRCELQACQSQECLRQKELDILNLSDQIKSYENQMIENEESHKQKDQKIVEYTHMIEYLRSMEKSCLDQHQASLKQKEAEIAELTIKMQHFEEAEKSQNEHYQEILTQRDNEASEHRVKIEHLQKVHSSLQEQLEHNSQSVREKEKEIEHLNLKMGQELKAKANQLGEVTAQLADVKTELDGVKICLAKKEKEKVFEEKKYKSACEQNALLEKQIRNLKESNENLKIEKEKKSKAKLSDITFKFEKIQKENKQYASEVNRLKTALDFSERKLKEYQKQLDAAGTALLGDNSHFHQTIAKSSTNDSLGGSPDSIGSSRSLRSRTRLSSGNSSFHSGLNETILSGDTVLLKRETIASSAELKKRVKPRKTTEDRLSICSTLSSQTTNSTAGIPGIHLPFGACANEPEEPDFEWDRLSELQRRNTMYLPHLKSAYPIEMQTVKREKLSDDGLRLSMVAEHGQEKSETTLSSKERRANLQKSGVGAKALKRTAPVMNLAEEISAEPSPPKQVRAAPNYHRPGPPTPGKLPKRVSGSFSPDQTLSPASTGKSMAFGSPITRIQARLTPKSRARRSPRLRTSPATSQAHKQDERRQSVAFNVGFSPMAKTGQTTRARKSPRSKVSPATSDANKHDERRQSVAFNIGFSPMASVGQMRPPRQTGLLPKKKLTQTTSSTTSKIQEPASQKFRRPLATRNFLETGI
ncbi:nuclear mitotic apparatus protein 1 [Elysia marginata]|uniref:Nuclear mitotic apparatus protein 1 n=1 Tax=Elysia marginata TaxID=1093978 RepID=A0AAV4FHN1_9GAST|nr:nuclear mitotic apparatus protein 1 [Elysia marginata]